MTSAFSKTARSTPTTRKRTENYVASVLTQIKYVGNHKSTQQSYLARKTER